ncbi:hypothetical protein Ae201684P_001509 [Aphanomyces euteiches]|nr:hypothetical protein Ae201684P_001509 [Aphanomyces euteiches]
MTPIVCPISMSVACVLRQCRQRDMPAVLPQATTGARLPLQTSWTDRIISPAMTTCFFNGCANPVQRDSWKCYFHRNRGRCVVEHCTNQAYARQLCSRHGGKKECLVDGCHLRARLANVCYRHGARNLNKKCIAEGCTKPAQFQNKCVRHGGGRKCKIDGCHAHARCGGLCCRHGREAGIVKSKGGRKQTASEEHASIVLVESFLATIEWADLDEISSLKCNVDVSSASAWRHLL